MLIHLSPSSLSEEIQNTRLRCLLAMAGQLWLRVLRLEVVRLEVEGHGHPHLTEHKPIQSSQHHEGGLKSTTLTSPQSRSPMSNRRRHGGFHSRGGRSRSRSRSPHPRRWKDHSRSPMSNRRRHEGGSSRSRSWSPSSRRRKDQAGGSGGGGGPVCWTCSKRGHISRDCPLKG